MHVSGPVGPRTDRTAATLSVVIAHLNQPEHLADCLAALMSGQRLPDEVIVVDNGSAIPPAALCARYPLVRLLVEPAPGPGPARNAGIAAARGSIVAFTDADCRPAAGWLAAVERACADPSAMILGGDVRIAPADPARLTMAEAYETLFSFRAARYIRRNGFALTCNLAARADVLRAVGGFAGRALAEDVDWGQRAGALGFTIRYLPDMVVAHPARPSMQALRRKWDRQTAHAFAALPPARTARLRWALRGLAMLPSPLIELPRVLFSPRVHGVRARVLAFAGLCHIRFHRCRVMLWLWSGADTAQMVEGWNREQGQG